MFFVRYFQNFYENRCNSNAPDFSRMHRLHFFSEVDASDASLVILPTSIENVGKKKKTCAVD